MAITKLKSVRQSILQDAQSDEISMTNTLFYGNNLEVLRHRTAAGEQHIPDNSVDLVYLDPPFNSDQNYNVLFAEQDGTRSAAQIQAFEDAWRWDQAAEEAYQEVVEMGGSVSEAMRAFRTFIGPSDMLAYLSMMAPRLVELHHKMKPTASIYLHCDPTASHYLKMLMDSIFGPENFRNEIIWRRTGSHNARRSFGPIHDVILFYSKTRDYKFNIVRRPYMEGHVESRYTLGDDGRYRFTSGGNVLSGAGTTEGDSGREWRGFNPTAKGRHWAVPGFYEEFMPPEYQELEGTQKLEALYQAGYIQIVEGNQWPTMVRYLEERDGVPLQDIWAYQPYTDGTVHGTPEGIDADVAWMGPTDPERLGYPTQKPDGLLMRILLASSDEGDTVLDPFCGCGTTIAAAQKLNRQWLGIDVTHLAVGLIKSRIFTAFGKQQGTDYKVVGEPTDEAGARQLATEDTHQFEHWALGLCHARASAKGKGADRGIDGRLLFHDEAEGGETKQVVFSVKSGRLKADDVRALLGVIERDKVEIGVLVTLHSPTAKMIADAAAGGFYTSPWGRHPRIQILTIEELIGGAQVNMPPVRQTNVTFRKAQRVTKPDRRQKNFEM